ncbi:hypothetical protein [Paractinoplanes brasiliensis]|uniref:Fibronectin type-III domain-containing protein n=1 Tax=Paractinoplanes brasiliensis TaxID=52695 RepID=A0A4R6JNQ4_9ACTN|nr:hypothetical protein [Actinoplanes brasiliensis]TDO38020.1 hypothetical protein C8E87_1662 [Actinoplanes brasiliensis]GID31111.1 hypothetical protein Abr02nite_60940 [Actinoplanes brasiliensis]
MGAEWEEEYKVRVLDPARQAGNEPPQDLFTRYGLTGAHQTPERFDDRVQEVVRYWNRLLNTRVYKPLANALLTAHQELRKAEALSPAEFTRRRDEARAKAAERLAGWIATVAAGVPYVTRGALAHFVRLGGGILTEKEVRKALADGGVKLIDPEWDLPSQAPVPAAGAVPRNLRVLGLRLSPQVVFAAEALDGGFRIKDGFRLTGGDGGRLTAELLHQAKQEQAKRPHDTRKTATETVLTTMLTAYATGDLDRLVRWEAAEIVRSALANGLPPTLAADALNELGLDRGEALELAVTVAAAGPGRTTGPPDDVNAVIAAELVAGRLRAAQAELATAPEKAVDKEVRDRVDRAAAAVDEFAGKAGEAEREGRTEDAAWLLAEAIRLAADDAGLVAHLARFPPPEPAEVVAGPGPGRVTLRWQPSRTRTGEVSYRVVRRDGLPAMSPEDGDPVIETTATSASDTAPPVARPVVYTVFAVRGDAVSRGAAAGPVVLLPPVTGLTLTGDGHAVTGSWLVDPAAVQVTVTCTRLDGDGPPRPVATRPGAATGFVDPEAELGVAYSYRVTVHYHGPDGERLESEAVAGHIVADHPPAAVPDLSAEVAPGDRAPHLALSWTAPRGGRVEIRRATTAPAWNEGDTVPAAEADGHGEVIATAAGPDTTGRCVANAPAGQGRFFLTAVTRGPGIAVIGNTVALELTAPVSGLRLRRRGADVHVSWIWPEDAYEARVEWSTNETAGNRTYGRREVRDSGGVLLPLGLGAVSISVRTVVRERHAELLSVPVAAELPGRSPRVLWWLERTRMPRPRRTLLLSTDQPCQIPELELTLGEKGGDGRPEPEVLIRLPGRWLPADRLSAVDVTSAVPGPLVPSVRCDFAEPPPPPGISLAQRRK